MRKSEKPFMVEFSGTPEAGKTTAINAVVNMLERDGYKTIEELEKDIIEYIEYYNNKRIKSKLKGMSPVQYRVHSQAA